MQSSTFVVVILLLASAAYRWGKNRSIALVGGTRGIRHLHSLPAYYGMYVALWCGLPALVLLGLWHLVGDRLVLGMVLAQMPAEFQHLSGGQAGLLLNDIRNVVSGAVSPAFARPEVVAAAAHWTRLTAQSTVAGGVVALSTALRVELLLIALARASAVALPRVASRSTSCTRGSPDVGARSSGVHAKWRFAVSSLVGVSAGLVAGVASPWQFAVLVGWNVGAAVTLAWIWRDVAGCDATSTRRIATLEDPSRTAIDIVLTAASVVSLGGMVAGLRAADHLGGNWAIALDTASVCTVATSWVLVHSLFALRYARLYYREPVGGIDFHGQEIGRAHV